MTNKMTGTLSGALSKIFTLFPQAARFKGKAIGGLTIALLILTQTAAARTFIDNDPGGPIEQRLRQIQHLRSDGGRVEIRGFCASSCTMLIGLPNVCVRPESRLGFHGPSSAIHGLGLAPDDFEYWSRVMANHYPNRIRNWFMSSARNDIMGLKTISGREAIKMGAHSC